MPCLLRLYQTAVLTGESLRPLRRLVAYLQGFFFHKNVMTKRTVGSSYWSLLNQQSSQHLKSRLLCWESITCIIYTSIVIKIKGKV